MSILHLLGIKHPILLAPMAGVSTAELAAEVSNAGGLGALGLGASNLDVAKAQIQRAQALTSRPFQVNFFCHQPEPFDEHIAKAWIDYLSPEFERFGAKIPQALHCIYPSFLDRDDFLNLTLETRPRAASFHFGIPHDHQITALKNAGITTLATATNLPEALAIEAAGIDIIVAQGVEAGGHRGLFNPKIDGALTTVDLVQLLVKHCKCPLVAAGGIMNGQQAKYMLDIGAQAVQLGTAFVQCDTSNATSAYRTALFKQPVTQISASLSGRPARGLINAWHQRIDQPHRPAVAAYPYAYDLAKQLHTFAAKQDNQDYAAFWAGSNVSQIRKLEAGALVHILMDEMKNLPFKT